MARNVRTTHSELLRDPEVAAAYMSEALKDGDPRVILMALRNVAEAQEDSISGLAQRSELDRDRMYRMLSKSGNPDLSSFVKLAHGLGLRIRMEREPGHAMGGAG